MFHKEGSFTSPQGKRSIDTPLRKSDRRKLRDHFLHTAFYNLESDEILHHRLQTLCDFIFTDFSCSEILCRKIKKGSSKDTTPSSFVHVYLRTSSPTSNTVPLASMKENPVLEWPYPTTTQPILIEMMEHPYQQELFFSSYSNITNHNSNNTSILIPTLALLSILPLETYQNFHLPTLHVYSSVTKYLCRGANLMKAGIKGFHVPQTVTHRISSLEEETERNEPIYPTSLLQALRSTRGVVALAVPNNPQPFAMGYLSKDLWNDIDPWEEKFQRKTKNHPLALSQSPDTEKNKKGVGVYILTCYGDDLWRDSYSILSSSNAFHANHAWNVLERKKYVNPVGFSYYEDGNYGNIGFDNGQYVHGFKQLQEVEINTTTSVENELENQNNHESVSFVNEDEMNVAIQSLSVLDSSDTLTDSHITLEQDEITCETISHPVDTNFDCSCPSTKNDINDDEPISFDNHSHHIHSTQSEPQEEIVQPPTQDEVTTNVPPDTILFQIFYTSLLRIKKSELPMLVSTYYSKYFLASRPTDTFFDMKSTTYKKIGNFLMEQAKCGIIHISPSKDGKDPVSLLTDIDRLHKDLREMKQIIRGNQTLSIADTHLSRDLPEDKKKKRLTLVQLYAIPAQIALTLQLNDDDVKATHAKSDERKGTGLLTVPECRDILNNYLVRNELIDRWDPELARLNGPLCDLFFKKSAKLAQISGEQFLYPDSLPRKDLQAKWLETLDEAYAIVSIPGNDIISMKRGKAPTVLIEVEKRGSNKKFITRVRGLEDYEIHAPTFCNEVCKRFACAGTTEDESAGRATLKKGHVELVFQGNLSDELKALLIGDERLSNHGGVKASSYCLPKGAIEISLRKGVPSKKSNTC